MVLAAVVVFGAGHARGGEVTVVGSPRAGRPAPVVKDSGSLQQVQLPSGYTLLRPNPENGSTGEPAEAASGPTAEFSPTADVEEAAPDDGLVRRLLFREQPCPVWSIDYRFRALGSSNTSSEFGTPEPPPAGWSPAGRLDFPINSCWHGLHVARETPTWGMQFEWLMAQQGITGDTVASGWNPPNPDGSYTDLGLMQQRWSGCFGQTIDFSLDFQWKERIGRLPIEVWPIGGFRWQRFQITGNDLIQYKVHNAWPDPPVAHPGDVFLFNQQYYTGYLGGQFRTRLAAVSVTFQADWGYTWGYNVGHDLIAEGDQYTMDSTHGNAWHVGVIAELPLDDVISIGFQYDHLALSTFGTHHLRNLPRHEDSTWGNGVAVLSNQNWITAFVRFRY